MTWDDARRLLESRGLVSGSAPVSRTAGGQVTPASSYGGGQALEKMGIV